MNPKTNISAVTDSTTIPVIDVSNVSREVADQILATAIKHEWFYIDTKGTGLTKDNVDRMFELSKKFFDSPEDEKREVGIDNSLPRWVPLRSRSLDPENQKKEDFREALILADFSSNGNPCLQIPRALKGCSGEIFRFQNTCRELCMKVLTAFEMALETEEPGFLTLKHQKPSSAILGLHKYPAVPDDMDFNPETDMRIGAHSDYGSITLLFQREGQSGLEVRTPEGLWVPVPVVPAGFQGKLPPLVVNLGDLLHYWTNGLLRSNVHRVVFPKAGRRGGEDRYSITYFFCPTGTAKLLPLPCKIVRSMKPIEDGEQVGYGGGAAKSRPESAEEHIRNRTNRQKISR